VESCQGNGNIDGKGGGKSGDHMEREGRGWKGAEKDKEKIGSQKGGNHMRGELKGKEAVIGGSGILT